MVNLSSLNIVPPATTSIPKTSNGNDPPPAHIKIADKSPVRNIPGLTEFNTETGEVDNRENPWKERDQDDVQETVSEKQDKTTSEKDEKVDRHTKWKQEQKAKREAKEEAQLNKQLKNQALAKSLLLKGDLTGAAKALDMSPADLALYVDNARLGVPNKQEELTPEQKKQQDEDKFRQERLAFEKEQRQWKYDQTAYQYIRETIDPVLADKEKYEMINAHPELAKVKSAVYEYINKHYNDTYNKETKNGEILNATDILDMIEQQFFDNAKQEYELIKKFKKTSAFLGEQPENHYQEETDNASLFQRQDAKTRGITLAKSKLDDFYEPTIDNRLQRESGSRFPLHDAPEADERDEEVRDTVKDTPINKQATRRTSQSSNVPFALLSRAEREEVIKRERM